MRLGCRYVYGEETTEQLVEVGVSAADGYGPGGEGGRYEFNTGPTEES